MRVLIGCERFGRVRNAFRARGHEAFSNDIEPADPPSPYHLQGNLLELLAADQWDLLIAHPPCRHLAVSGIHWMKRGHPERTEKEMFAALEFVRQLLLAPVPRIAIENPVGVISTRLAKPSQIIQPFQFGHPESKKTCLWLKNLPRLQPTNLLPLPACGYWENQTPSRQNKLGPSPGRALERARTYEGIAAAMAEQWREKLEL